MELNLAKEIVEKLKIGGQKISFAESCTGGLLADALVSVSGASEVFLGSLVCYDTSIKRDVLGVEQSVLEAGVVSENCAVQMAKKARVLFGADIAVASTGYAESTPQVSKEDCVMYLAICTKNFVKVKKIQSVFSRNENRALARDCALKLILENI